VDLNKIDVLECTGYCNFLAGDALLKVAKHQMCNPGYFKKVVLQTLGATKKNLSRTPGGRRRAARVGDDCGCDGGNIECQDHHLIPLAAPSVEWKGFGFFSEFV